MKNKKNVFMFVIFMFVIFIVTAMVFGYKNFTYRGGQNNNTLNAFMDVSHLDGDIDLKQAKEDGIIGFIHKASQGVSFVDSKVKENIKQGNDLGLFVGVYHFGTAANVSKQIDNFLSVLGTLEARNIVPVLDWEPNPSEKEGSMTKEQAKEFIQEFHKRTNIYPVIYGGYWMLDQLREEKPEDVAVFSKSPLWQGFYSSKFGYLDGIWNDWTFIQYTDGKLGAKPHSVKGVGRVDRDMFNGTKDDVAKFWKNHSFVNKNIS